jgi:hypothetical protein
MRVIIGITEARVTIDTIASRVEPLYGTVVRFLYFIFTESKVTYVLLHLRAGF